ncbi:MULTISPECIES: hypothetical protein [unclassified Janthinobacterium]|uniref:hypothetical protein n=1 Tax=unclassified Janthinobacterium TaxID=2610881 RepID=UPI000C114F7F|nr:MULTISPECIES: hypothetical protein [unclassified Janthinobacterium]MDZ5636398.1 hypothetical protein [Janthinobacterium sp. GMG1]PHV26122.1 hypothetical protein CSQ93_20245 [Janthinobacterium sp. BJB426]
MSDEYQFSDSRALNAPFTQQLSRQPPDGALAWLSAILATQAPMLRSSNAILLAYTGNPAALTWIDANIGSPVAGQWGVAAALLDTPWPQIVDWLQRGGAHRLMALDTLLAYRKPAVNMSPLEQIAAPVLPQAPARAELDAALAACLAASSTPRIQAAISSINKHVDEILRGGPRGVAVADLPRLYLDPAPFKDAPAILEQHEAVVGGMRQNLQNLLKGIL